MSPQAGMDGQGRRIGATGRRVALLLSLGLVQAGALAGPREDYVRRVPPAVDRAPS